MVCLLVGVVSFGAARYLVTSRRASRRAPVMDQGLQKAAASEVSVTTADGLRLAGWYVPSTNGAAVLAVHGYRSSRAEMTGTALMLHERGYGVLLASTRGHDASEGEQITFGYREMADLEAWYQYLLTRKDVNPDRIGAIGNSMGGGLVILYAARNPRIRAVVSNCGFSSLEDVVNTSVRKLTRLPTIPFAPLIVWSAELQTGGRPAHLNAKAAIRKLSPRPVLLMQGGADDTIPPQSGQWLYDAAGEPKELWFDPKVIHCGFEGLRYAEFVERVGGFFDKYLVNGAGPQASPSRNAGSE